MEENNKLLKFIYHEDLYIIDEPSEPENQKKENVAIEKKAVAFEHDIEIPVIEEPQAVSYFGKNEKGIIILVNDPTNDLLNQSDLDLLMKIVEGGLRYSKNDFALINTSQYPVDQILAEIDHEYLIAFGIDDPALLNKSALYENQEIDGKKVLFSEALSVLSKDQSKKMQLWKALKTMFNI